jgi:hypothetical protein
VRNEVAPSQTLIILASQNLTVVRGLECHIFVDFVNSPQVAEVPVETRSELRGVGRDGGYYNVAAIPRIPRQDESPRTLGKSYRLGDRDFDLVQFAAAAKMPGSPSNHDQTHHGDGSQNHAVP